MQIRRQLPHSDMVKASRSFVQAALQRINTSGKPSSLPSLPLSNPAADESPPARPRARGSVIARSRAGGGRSEVEEAFGNAFSHHVISVLQADECDTEGAVLVHAVALQRLLARSAARSCVQLVVYAWRQHTASTLATRRKQDEHAVEKERLVADLQCFRVGGAAAIESFEPSLETAIGRGRAERRDPFVPETSSPSQGLERWSRHPMPVRSRERGEPPSVDGVSARKRWPLLALSMIVADDAGQRKSKTEAQERNTPVSTTHSMASSWEQMLCDDTVDGNLLVAAVRDPSMLMDGMGMAGTWRRRDVIGAGQPASQPIGAEESRARQERTPGEGAVSGASSGGRDTPSYTSDANPRSSANARSLLYFEMFEIILHRCLTSSSSMYLARVCACATTYTRHHGCSPSKTPSRTPQLQTPIDAGQSNNGSAPSLQLEWERHSINMDAGRDGGLQSRSSRLGERMSPGNDFMAILSRQHNGGAFFRMQQVKRNVWAPVSQQYYLDSKSE